MGDRKSKKKIGTVRGSTIGSLEVVELLLSAGADPFFAGPDGTALEVAARVGDAETTEVRISSAVSNAQISASSNDALDG